MKLQITVITPRACTRDKVIGSVIIFVIVVHIKISKSGDLGTWVSYMHNVMYSHNKSAKIWQKTGLVSVLESSSTAFKHDR